MQELSDIPYVPHADKFNLFDLYVPPSSNPSSNPLICWVHGGGWTSEDKSQYAFLGRELATTTSCTVAIINYRTSTPGPDNKDVHPAHAEDVLRFLSFAVAWTGPDGSSGPLYDPTRIYVAGHSCGAHMITSVLLKPPAPHAEEAALVPSRKVLQAVRGAIVSQGAYDFDLLIKWKPEYKQRFFILPFGDRASYAALDTTKYGLRAGGEHIRWLVIHSQGDNIVNPPQAENYAANLKGVLKAAGQGEENVQLHTEFNVAHMEVLHIDGYPKLVASFVAKAE